MFISGYFFSRPDPSDEICGAAFWYSLSWFRGLYHVVYRTSMFGFSITFAPLFAKAWRIYKVPKRITTKFAVQIFMRTKMTVVKISDFNLAGRVAAYLLLELV